MKTRRYLCVYFPLWAIDLLANHLRVSSPQKEDSQKSVGLKLKLDRRGEQFTASRIDNVHALAAKASLNVTPIILHQKNGAQLVVARCCPRAYKSGVRFGMALPLAQALTPPETLLLPFQPEEDFRLLCKLGEWAIKFTPLVALDSELIAAYRKRELSHASHLHYGVTLDITGTDRLHGSEALLSQRILRALSLRKIHARLAIAPTVGAAWALARYSAARVTIVPPTEAPDLLPYLASLPVQSLRFTEETTDTLRALGLETVGLLAALPRKKLGLRFKRPGAAEGILTRLQQALGTQREPLRFIRPKTHISAQREFEVPLTNHAALRVAILQLVETIFMRLEKIRRTTRTIILELVHRNFDNSHTTTRKELTLCNATQNISHASSVLTPLIESIQSQEGICSVRIYAHLTARIFAQQFSILEDTAATAALQDSADELINHFVTRLGRARVSRVALNASHIPEDSFKYESVMQHSSPTPSGCVPFFDRPALLFATPQAVSAIAMLPDKPPSQLQWNGARLQVVKGAGPERICQEWWNSSVMNSNVVKNGTPAARDYFQVQDQHGRWLWVFRESDSLRWFVHGVWM